MTHALPLFDAPVTESEDGGFGALETPRGCLPLTGLDVRGVVSGLLAQTAVRQTFRNAYDEPLEATYIFPLPDRAAVTRFRMIVADRVIEGELKERGKAREAYDAAIEKGHRAALAEEERSGVFTMRVGNIPPHEIATVELDLVGPLEVAADEATYRFPLVVAPRYTPGTGLDGPPVGDGVSPDTDHVPDASRVTPPVLLPGFPNPVRLSLEVELDLAGLADGLSGVHSSLHSVVIQDSGPPWIIRLQPGERLNRDFLLRFPVAKKTVQTALQCSPAVEGKPGVFAVSLLPPQLAVTQPRPREVVFALDHSGSMSGWKMVAARRALGRMIDTLLDQDRFTVIAFDSTLSWPGQKAAPARGRSPRTAAPSNEGEPAIPLLAGTNRNRWQVLEWLGSVEACGGTEMGPVLKLAMRCYSPPTADVDRVLVVVTDGQVTGEDALLRTLKSSAGGAMPRVFTLGIDQAVNAGFLRRLAALGGGVCDLVESEDRLDQALDGVHRLIGQPVLSDVRFELLNFDGVSESLAPSRVAGLFADRPVTVFGRHLSDKQDLRLRVHATDPQGKPWSADVAAQPAPATVLRHLWGRAKVRELEDQYAAEGIRNETLAEKIVQVSLESGVLCRFTAYVAVDKSEIVNAGGVQHQVVQPVELPAGWEASDLVLRFAPHSCMSPEIAGVVCLRSYLPMDRMSKKRDVLSSPDDDDLLLDNLDDTDLEAFDLAPESPNVPPTSGYGGPGPAAERGGRRISGVMAIVERLRHLVLGGSGSSLNWGELRNILDVIQRTVKSLQQAGAAASHEDFMGLVHSLDILAKLLKGANHNSESSFRKLAEEGQSLADSWLANNAEHTTHAVSQFLQETSQQVAALSKTAQRRRGAFWKST